VLLLVAGDASQDLDGGPQLPVDVRREVVAADEVVVSA
jgi:hypothetical protein